MNGVSKGTKGSVDLGKVVVGASNVQHAFIENPSADGSYVFAQDLTINGSNQVAYSNFDDSISFPDMVMFGEVSDGLQSAQQDITGAKSDIANLKSGKQDKLTAGSHITISGTTISAVWPTIPTVGNGALTIKVGGKGDVAGTGSFTANQSSASTITLPVYTKTEVDEKIVGAVQYLGTVASANELAALNPDSVGDFCRVSTAFGSYHVGDLLLCKTTKTSSAAATWDVIHGEIDKNTWTANSASADGYVTKGSGQANKVWKTDASGNPAWRDDANTNTAHTHTNGVGLVRTGDGGASGTVDYKVALVSEEKDANVAGTGKLYPIKVDKNGKLAVNVPWTDTNTDTGVTSVNVTGTGNAVTAASISGRALTLTKDATYLTSHQDISGKQDKIIAGTHITIGSDKKTINAVWPTTSDSGYGGINSTGTVKSVSAGVGLKVTGNASITPTVEIDDATVFILDCGSSTTNI